MKSYVSVENPNCDIVKKKTKNSPAKYVDSKSHWALILKYDFMTFVAFRCLKLNLSRFNQGFQKDLDFPKQILWTAVEPQTLSSPLNTTQQVLTNTPW